jgi:hypothetical protein
MPQDDNDERDTRWGTTNEVGIVEAAAAEAGDSIIISIGLRARKQSSSLLMAVTTTTTMALQQTMTTKVKRRGVLVK